MRYPTLILVIFLASGFNQLSAQPNIQSAEDYTIGNSWLFAKGYTQRIDSIQAGANVTWDFTDLGVQDSLKLKILHPDSAENGDQFPNADFVERNNKDNIVYQNRQSNGNLYVGLKTVNEILIEFIRPFKAVPRPVTYQDQ
ncbi:MAG: hypothetical protein BRD49_03690, partial [Bacteroidetes bacterium SW_10_40_5]